MPTREYLWRQARRVGVAVLGEPPGPVEVLARAAEPAQGLPHPLSAADRYAHLQREFRDSLRERYGAKHQSQEIIRHAIDGSIKLLDALALSELLNVHRPQRILEVGSYLGFSTRWILESTVPYGSTVTSLDPRVRHRIFDDIKDHLLSFCAAHAPRLTCVDAFLSARDECMYDYLHYEPRLSEAEARAIIARVPLVDAPFAEFDFAFIDGDHGFNATVLNVHLAARMLPVGGLVIIHDAISWPDVAPALRALCTPDAGLEFEGIAGAAFHGHAASSPAVQRLSDGLGIVRVGDPDAVRRFDPRSLQR